MSKRPSNDPFYPGFKPISDDQLSAIEAKNNVMPISPTEVSFLVEQARRANALERAAMELRTCQLAYMQHRGDDELGRRVTEAAATLDKALAAFKGSTP